MPDPQLIDVHHHILPPQYVRAIGATNIGKLLVSGKMPNWTPEVSLQAMERNGIQKAYTSMSAPGLTGLGGDEAKKVVREFNEFAAAMCSEWQDRFGTFSYLPLPYVDLSISEIEHVYDELHTDGVCLLTSYGDHLLGDPLFDRVFACLNDRRAIVFVHPDCGSCVCDIAGVPAATLEFPFDTTRAIVSLMMNGVFQRYPKIQFIFSHAGGTVPFLAARLSRLERMPRNQSLLETGVISILRKLFYDTALSANQYAVSSLLKLVEPRQVLFGSDFPFAPEDTMAASVKGLEQLGLPTSQLAAIQRENAISLFANRPADGRTS